MEKADYGPAYCGILMVIYLPTMPPEADINECVFFPYEKKSV